MTYHISTESKSLDEIQLLFSQVLHDLISPFSSLSAGMDIVTHSQDEIWDLVNQAKHQLYIQLILSRCIFSYGEGSYAEGEKLIVQYAESLEIGIQGKMPEQIPLKLCVGLAFWLIKQAKPRSDNILSWEKGNYLLHLSGSGVKKNLKEEHVLQDGALTQSPQESYAMYLYRLLRHYGYKANTNRTSDSLSLKISKIT